MANSWPKVKFGSIYKEPSRNGLTKPKKVRGEGYKFINMGEIFAFDRMDNIPCDRAPLTDKEKASSLLKDGDLLFARQSLVLSGAGKCSIFLGDKEEVAFESHLIRVRLDTEKVNPEYAYYYFKSPQGRANIATIVEQGAGQAGIRGSDLEKLDFPLPPLNVQNSIVEAVRPCDLKLEINQATNQTLEQMAQVLFKSWFVDFDPVIDNALATGNDIPEALQHKAEQREQAQQLLDFKPLPEHIRALFPSEFEQTEESTVGFEGWIPKGWNCKAVSEAIIINPRVSMPKGTVAKFADMKAVPTSGYMVNEVIEKEFKGGSKFQKNDVILARITPCLENGKTALVDFLQDDEVGFGSTEFIVLRENGAVNYPFIACLAREDNFRQHCIQNMVGSSGRQRVQNSCFDVYHLALPENERVLNIFNELTKPSFGKMIINKDEINTLVKVRDTLLPKLISGELEVPTQYKDMVNG